jgi:alpha,alpha-trehalase
MKNRPQEYFFNHVDAAIFDLDGVLADTDMRPFCDAVAFLERLRERDIETAAVSPSQNGAGIPRRLQLGHLFDAKVDESDIICSNSDGKPSPGLYVEAARRLENSPISCVVFGDTPSGVEAAKATEFAAVIGIARHSDGSALSRSGADFVINNFQQLGLNESISALHGMRCVLDEIGHRTPVFFFDYDGTLTPIVDDPRKATLSQQMRKSLETLARSFPTAIISGRDLADVRERVGLPGIAYAGSHGFEILSPDGRRIVIGPSEKYVPELDEAVELLDSSLEDVPGSLIERKRFAIAVHYRQVRDSDLPRLEESIDNVVARLSGLRKTWGKKIFEIRPDVDWDKGKAVEWLRGQLELDTPDHVPVYIGDDLTDEDAFRALRDSGVSILVSDEKELGTTASYRLQDPQDVQQFLTGIADSLDCEKPH